eukprot:Skav236367  [mRNA]  locus=scaffold1770:187178:189243:+ [translate_table: standard]
MFKRILMSARRFLMHASDWDQLTFLELATNFRGTIATVRGPAAALGYVLAELDWRIDIEGVIRPTAFVTFSIYTCSKKRLASFLQQSWLEGLVMNKSTRTRHFRSGDINREETVSILRTLPETKLLQAIKHIAFSSQDGAQRMNWNQDDEGNCLHCGQPDTRTHRLLECSMGDDHRVRHHDLIARYYEEGSDMAEFSVITTHPFAEATQALCFAAPAVSLSEVAVDFVRNSKLQGRHIAWYTDGSCQHPSLTTKYSAFTVVLDLAADDAHRVRMVQQHGSFSLEVPTFACVGAARTQGEQDILRSELEAATAIVLQCGYGTVYLDSQVARTLLLRALTVPRWQMLADHAHCDLLIEVWQIRNDVDMQFIHVKSHQEHDDTLPPLQRYHHWGNAYADAKAAEACASLQASLVTMFSDIHSDLQLQRQLLPMVLQLHDDLRTVRAFSAWAFEGGQFFPRPDTTPFQQFSAWGEGTACAFLDWVSAVEWPPPDMFSGPLEQSTGTAWIELVLSFIFHQQRLVPIVRQASDSGKRVINLGTMQDAQEYGTSLDEQAKNFRLLWDQTAALQPEVISPQQTRKKIPAIYIQVFHGYVQGFTTRPKLPCQGQVARLLHDRFKDNAKSLAWLPFFDLQTTTTELLPGTWCERSRAATYKMRLVRLARLPAMPG